MIRILSLGAGVQSSTLYLMAVRGEFGDDRPEAAIFADTQWEPRAVYDWLDFLEREGGATIPIRRVTQGNIREAALTTRVNPSSGRRSRVVSLPVFLVNPDGTGGMLHRQCTRDFKIRPIRRGVRAVMGQRGVAARPGAVEQWIGISTDEASRMKDSGVKYITNRFPLIERDMSRADCLTWMQQQGFPVPPKSACIGCPYTGADRWRELRKRPDEWADALDFDRSIRTLPEVNGTAFLHPSRVPLDQAELGEPHPELFDNECAGVCGV